jgi:hypothetical protein
MSAHKSIRISKFMFPFFASILTASAATNGLSVTGNQIVAGRLTFQMGSNSLPAQIAIEATPEELPLERRKPGAKVSDQELEELGRGPQLKAPMRLEVMTAGKTVTLVPMEFTAPTLNNEVATSRAKLVGGGVNATVESVVGCDGSLVVKVTYGGGSKVESLALAMEINGVVDTAVSGGAPFTAKNFSLGEGEGLLWGNAAPVAGAALTEANRGVSGVIPHLFWGSGDRGWTWLTEGENGWMVVPAAPTMTLTRDKTGAVIWRVLLVNQPANLKGERTVVFTLLTHPSVSRAVGFRKSIWLDWPFSGKAPQIPPLSIKARPGLSGLVRADAGSVVEARAGALLLEGPAGGEAVSAAKTLADTFPLALFRYLAGTHTGVGGRLLANSPNLVRPGQSPDCDRMVLGRALLHDVGVDPAGVTHLALMARVVGALSKFGYFETDGQVEYIPYWRSQTVVRYGEAHSGKDAFEENASDPMSRVKVSIWRRPAEGGRGAKALLLMINEGAVPVREQLYILNPQRLFGRPNALRYKDCTKQWDLSSIPADSDWAGIKNAEIVSTDKFLLDLEDLGGTREVSNKGGLEVYGRTFIPAKGFRLLWGSAVSPSSGGAK